MQKTETDEMKFILRDSITETAEGGLSDLNGCPCFHCVKLARCGVRQTDSPLSCRKLEEWLMSFGAS